jgi:acid phosphatase class B
VLAYCPRAVVRRAPSARCVSGVSYGDSDGDLADAHEADPAIRTVRFMRSPVSDNQPPVAPGRYGEDCLASSTD